MSFTWDAPTDGNINAIALEVENVDSFTNEVDQFFPNNTTTSFRPVALTDNKPFAAELGFVTEFMATNVDGVSFLVSKGSFAEIAFDTGDPGGGGDLLAQIGGVFIERLVDHDLPGSGGDFEFELGFDLTGPDTLNAARFQAPGGQWYDITSNQGNQWLFECERSIEVSRLLSH